MKNIPIPFFNSDFNSLLRIPDQRQYEVFLQYKEFVARANQLDKLDRILEMGSGYSTVLLGLLAKHRGCTVYSVDVSFNTVKNAVRGTQFEPIVQRHVRLMEGATISSNEFNDFFSEPRKKSLGGIPASEIRDQFRTFARRLIDFRKWDRLGEVLGSVPDQAELERLFFADGHVVFPKNIMNIYHQAGDEFDIYSPAKPPVKGVVDGILAEGKEFDVIFFDCGEFSGYPEWEKLHGNIRSGGLAVFHDIYFPKSFKNFLVCAAVAGSPEWEVEYIDESTPQGMMIARRR